MLTAAVGNLWIFGSLMCISWINKVVACVSGKKKKGKGKVPTVYSERWHDLEDNLFQEEKHSKTSHRVLKEAAPAHSPNIFRTEANTSCCNSRLLEFSPVDTQINLYHRLPGFCGLVCQQQLQWFSAAAPNGLNQSNLNFIQACHINLRNHCLA